MQVKSKEKYIIETNGCGYVAEFDKENPFLLYTAAKKSDIKIYDTLELCLADVSGLNMFFCRDNPCKIWPLSIIYNENKSEVQQMGKYAVCKNGIEKSCFDATSGKYFNTMFEKDSVYRVLDSEKTVGAKLVRPDEHFLCYSIFLEEEYKKEFDTFYMDYMENEGEK